MTLVGAGTPSRRSGQSMLQELAGRRAFSSWHGFMRYSSGVSVPSSLVASSSVCGVVAWLRRPCGLCRCSSGDSSPCKHLQHSLQRLSACRSAVPVRALQFLQSGISASSGGRMPKGAWQLLARLGSRDSGPMRSHARQSTVRPSMGVEGRCRRGPCSPSMRCSSRGRAQSHH